MVVFRASVSRCAASRLLCCAMGGGSRRGKLIILGSCEVLLWLYVLGLYSGSRFIRLADADACTAVVVYLQPIYAIMHM